MRIDQLCLSLADRRAQSHEFSSRQEPLTTVFLELLDPAPGIHAFWDDAAPACEGVHATYDSQHAIGLERRFIRLL
jgi:hypothetical protein